MPRWTGSQTSPGRARHCAGEGVGDCRRAWDVAGAGCVFGIGGSGAGERYGVVCRQLAPFRMDDGELSALLCRLHRDLANGFGAGVGGD